ATVAAPQAPPAVVRAVPSGPATRLREGRIMAEERTGQGKAADGTESHDPDFPEAFLSFMRQGWRDTELPVTPRAEVPNHAKRRAALAEAFPGETLVNPTGNEKVRANDTDHRF